MSSEHLPRTMILLFMVLLLIAPWQTWWTLGGGFMVYLDHESLPGQELYILAKLAALYGFELLALQALLGLQQQRWVGYLNLPSPRLRHWHQRLGMLTMFTVLAHVVLFVVATSIRNQQPAWDLLWPWGKGYYRTWVAVGAGAVWLLLMAVAAQGLLRRPVFRRALHRLGLLSLVMVLGHSLCIGTESHSGLMALVVPLLGVMLAGAVLDFLWRQWKLSIQGGVSRAQLT